MKHLDKKVEKTSGVQSTCKQSHIPRAPPLWGEQENYWQKSVQVVLGSVSIQSAVLLSALVSSLQIEKACHYHRYFLFKLLPFYLVVELLVPTGRGRDREENISSLTMVISLCYCPKLL